MTPEQVTRLQALTAEILALNTASLLLHKAREDRASDASVDQLNVRLQDLGNLVADCFGDERPYQG